MKNKKIKSFFGGILLAVASVYAQNPPEITSLIMEGLLPEPQTLVSFPKQMGIHPNEINGFYLKGKAKIPFGLSYFTDKSQVKESKGSILLELTRKVTNVEGYELNVTKDGVKLKARTQKGLFYGMMTLEQMAKYAN